MQIITVKEVEYISFRLAKKLLSFDEPTPDFSTRFPNILESSLAMPFITFRNKSPYSTLIDKASILFYLLIKNHPFQNGNKRIALTTLLVFFYKNNKWLSADTQELYNFTIWIAQSPAALKEETVKAISHFIKKHIINL